MNDVNDVNLEREEIQDIRSWFDPKKSSKANVIDCLEVTFEAQSDVRCANDHWRADMALLALINDPEITEAYLKILRSYGE